MASLLRQIVAGPRARHDETGLDLCYVTSNIIATSGPSQTYPQLAYRNPLDRLVVFLDRRHGDSWAIWEFRAEGTGYPDEAVYHRIRHYPWPDHHPPPFALVPLILASMRQWLQGAGGTGCEDDDDGGGGGSEGGEDGSATDRPGRRVAVVHCKAGKGRSGTVACSYLIAECGWSPRQALDRFTQRRMRPHFGAGVTIPSQLRWIAYVDRWTRHGKPAYVDGAVEIVAIRVWGLRPGVKLAVEGYVDEGKKIHIFHTFTSDERHAEGGGAATEKKMGKKGTLETEGTEETKGTEKSCDGAPSSSMDTRATSNAPAVRGASARPLSRDSRLGPTQATTTTATTAATVDGIFDIPSCHDDTMRSRSRPRTTARDEPAGAAVLFRPQTPVRVPTRDVNIAMERRHKTSATMGLALVTSVAHVWFNTYFEGGGPEQGGRPDAGGVFAISWGQLDGIKGSSQKGSRALDKMAVVWRAVAAAADETATTDASTSAATASIPLTDEPVGDELVPQMRPASWRGRDADADDIDPDAHRHLGLRREASDSVDVSRANSLHGASTSDSGRSSVERGTGDAEDAEDASAGVKTSGPEGVALHEDGRDQGLAGGGKIVPA